MLPCNLWHTYGLPEWCWNRSQHGLSLQLGSWNGSTTVTLDRQELTMLPSYFPEGICKGLLFIIGNIDSVWWKDTCEEKTQKVEAEVMWKGFLLAGLVMVLKTHAFVGKKKSMTAGILHYEKPSGFSCCCPMGFPRSVILTVLWQYAGFSFFSMILICGVCIWPNKTIFHLHCW